MPSRRQIIKYTHTQTCTGSQETHRQWSLRGSSAFPLQGITEVCFFPLTSQPPWWATLEPEAGLLFFGSAQNRTHYSSWDLTGTKHNRKIILPVLPDRLPVINPRAQFPWQEHDLLTHPGFVTFHNVHLLFHKTATVDPCLLCVHRAILRTYPFCVHLLTHTF